MNELLVWEVWEIRIAFIIVESWTVCLTFRSIRHAFDTGTVAEGREEHKNKIFCAQCAAASSIQSPTTDHNGHQLSMASGRQHYYWYQLVHSYLHKLHTCHTNRRDGTKKGSGPMRDMLEGVARRVFVTKNDAS